MGISETLSAVGEALVTPYELRRAVLSKGQALSYGKPKIVALPQSENFLLAPRIKYTTFLLSKQTMGIKIPPMHECETAISCIILRMQRLHCELSARPPHHLFEQRFRESLKPRE